MTKIMNKLASNPFLMLTLVGYMLFFLTSCQSNKSVVPAELTGEEIFKGVIFFEGELTKSVPYLKDMADIISELKAENLVEETQIQKSNYEKFKRDILDGIRKNDVNYFKNLKIQMTSGDPYVVKRSLQEAGQRIKLYMESSKQLKEENINKESIQKILESNETKKFLSKGTSTKEEKKQFIVESLKKLDKETKTIANAKTAADEPGTNCLAFFWVFVGVWLFILAGVFVYIGGIIAVGVAAAGTVLWEDWQFFEPEEANATGGSYQTAQDININQLTVELSSN